MFTASQYEFRSSPDVRRNFPFPTLRTEEAPTRWLLGKCNTRGHNLYATQTKTPLTILHGFFLSRRMFCSYNRNLIDLENENHIKKLHRTAAVTGLVVAVQSHLKAPCLVSKETLPWLLMGLCLNLRAMFVCVCVCVCTEADFVGSVLLKESINSSIGDDDKIYFFFTERSQEQIAYPSQTKVSRVARVCKVRESEPAEHQR